MKLWRNDKPATAKAKTWPRNYAIVIMLLTTELRNAELLDLTPADLHWEDGELSVESGKGSKFRRIEFPDIAQSAVRIYLASGIRPKDLPDTAPLFGNTAPKGSFGPRTGEESRQWQRGSRQWLSTLVESHVRAVTGVPNIRSHDLRHVGARIDLNAGMKQEELQSKLGHTNPNVTQRYSGRLLSRTGKRSAALVLEARERQADINANILAGSVQNV
nr:MAG TPA: SITE SPECIFIC RECOMBINASE XERD [Caudoviricetes sp.]